MTRISDSTIADIKARADIVDILSEHTSIPAAQDRFMVSCPLHDDRTPSCHIDARKKVWFCHGACQRGGDAIGLWQELHNVTFGGSLRAVGPQVRNSVGSFRADRQSAETGSGSAGFLWEVKTEDISKEAKRRAAPGVSGSPGGTCGQLRQLGTLPAWDSATGSRLLVLRGRRAADIRMGRCHYRNLPR